MAKVYLDELGICALEVIGGMRDNGLHAHFGNDVDNLIE